MSLYVHTCLSQVSGIAMMANCLISVMIGLSGSGKHGSATVDEELAKCPFIYKYFRIAMLSVSILFNLGRFVYECKNGDVMLISLLFRFFGSIIQLLEHLHVCNNYERYFPKLEGESFFWTRLFLSMGGFCGLGIFSGLAGVNGYGKSADEHIYWSLSLCLLTWGGLIWGRWQEGGIGRTKYLMSRVTSGLCFLATLILVVADPTANGFINRIIIGVLFICFTIFVHILHRRDVQDLASIHGAAEKERSRQSNPESELQLSERRLSAISERRLSQPMSTTALGRSNKMVSTKTVVVAPSQDEECMCSDDSLPHNNNIPLSTLPAHPGVTQHVESIDVLPGTVAAQASYQARRSSRRRSYDFVSDARRGRLINDIYMSKAVAIIGQVVGWYCFIFIVELCVYAYFITNFGSPPLVCPTFSSNQLTMWQVVVDSLF